MSRPSPVVLGSRRFTMADQERFAQLSGDANPIHVDAVYARRTQAGFPVVHGIHLALWCLEEMMRRDAFPPPARLRASFAKFLYVDEPVSVVRPQPGEDGIRLEARAGAAVVATIVAEPVARRRPADDPTLPRAASGRLYDAVPQPLDQPFADLAQIAGRVAPSAPARAFAADFPNTARALGAGTVAALAGLSRLVGMICPGQHSIFGGFEIDWTEAQHVADEIRFAVADTDARFHRVVMDVAGRGFTGRVSAFMRPAPVKQATAAMLSTLVRPDEFADTTSLIVGGSRGLGALTATLLACGGGRTIITYAVGREDAEAVATNIRRAGGRCDILAYDVRNPAADQVARLGAVSTHLYYFATPPISRQKRAPYQPELFREFSAFYVDGFYDLCRALVDRAPTPLGVLYPSSVYVEQRPHDLTEYAMAKAAGEALCADLPRALPALRILVRRLPRLATDQTMTLLEIETRSGAEIMLPIIRELHGRPASA